MPITDAQNDEIKSMMRDITDEINVLSIKSDELRIFHKQLSDLFERKIKVENEDGSVDITPVPVKDMATGEVMSDTRRTELFGILKSRFATRNN
jgi:hypothetical protein